MRTDPIADLLTRIRNASNAEHEKVDIPSSKLKVRIAELLKDEGFIKNFRVLEDSKQGTLRVYLKYGTGNEKMISGLVRVSTPGRRVYVTHDKIPSILAGMGVALLSTSRGRVHRSRGPQAEGRRRSPRLRVVGGPPCRASASNPFRFPQGVKIQVDGTTVRAEGPKGKLAQPVPAGLTPTRGRRHARDRARQRRAPRARAARPGPRAGGQHGHRRQGRLRAQARDRRHRLPRPDAGQEHPAGARLLAPGDLPAARRRHGRDRQADRPSPCAAPTRPCSGRRRPSCGRCASPIPTRARASSTRTRSSGARSARRRARNDHQGPAGAAGQAALPAAALGAGLGGAAAAGRVPQPQSHLRPGRRRRHRAHAGRGRQPEQGVPRRAAARAATWPPPRRSATLLAQRAKAAGVERVVFDRGGYQVPRARQGPGRRGARRRRLEF